MDFNFQFSYDSEIDSKLINIQTPDHLRNAKHSGLLSAYQLMITVSVLQFSVIQWLKPKINTLELSNIEKQLPHMMGGIGC